MIKHWVNIDPLGDVSAYCTEFTTDGSVNVASEATKVKIVLANINRKFDEVFIPQTHHFTIEATGNDGVWPVEKIAVGLISDVSCDSDYCTINGTCLIGTLADALPMHWSSNKLGPYIKDILTEVLALHDPPIEVDFQATNVQLHQKHLRGGKNVVSDDADFILAEYRFEPHIPHETRNVALYIDLGRFQENPMKLKSKRFYEVQKAAKR